MGGECRERARPHHDIAINAGIKPRLGAQMMIELIDRVGFISVANAVNLNAGKPFCRCHRDRHTAIMAAVQQHRDAVICPRQFSHHARDGRRQPLSLIGNINGNMPIKRCRVRHTPSITSAPI